MSNKTTGSIFCAIRGPLVLITLGSLFAVDHFGRYEFWRTWPVLIILLGLLKLLDRVFTTRPEAAPGGPQS